MKNIFILFFLTLIIFLFAHEEHEPHYKEGKHNPDHPHSESEIEEHRKDFNTYDLNQDGYLDAQEIREGINGVSDSEIMEFFDITDNDQSGTVDFEEYLRAALEVINTPEETHKHEEI